MLVMRPMERGGAVAPSACNNHHAGGGQALRLPLDRLTPETDCPWCVEEGVREGHGCGRRTVRVGGRLDAQCSGPAAQASPRLPLHAPPSATWPCEQVHDPPRQRLKVHSTLFPDPTPPAGARSAPHTPAASTCPPPRWRARRAPRTARSTRQTARSRAGTSRPTSGAGACRALAGSQASHEVISRFLAQSWRGDSIRQSRLVAHSKRAIAEERDATMS